MNLRKNITTLAAASLLAGSVTLGSCNEESDSTLIDKPVNLAVTSFSIKSKKGQQDLDTVFFSIDLQRHIIFNADSLRKGTDVSKVVASIKFSNDVSEAVIVMSGGTTREGEINYQETPGDSIDFTGNVELRVKAADNTIGTSYRIKVNVHNIDSDSLFWNETAKAQLPSRLGSPKRQKTVDMAGVAVSLIEENDGSYTLARCESLADYKWERKEAGFPFTPALETLTATDDSLWILDVDGHLYTSDPSASAWSDTGEVWTSMIGGYTGSVIGLRRDGSAVRFAQYPKLNIAEKEIPEDFPTSGISNFVTLANKWTQSPVAFFAGGRTSEGRLSSDTWAFDGSEWIKLCTGGIPALEGASIIPYYNYRPSALSNAMIEYRVWMLVGGRMADGKSNRTVYISYDNGVNWAKGAQSLQLPDCIPAMTGCDNIVSETELSANLSDAWKFMQRGPRRVNYQVDGDVIVWGCPYIYLFGGYAPDGTLYDTVWKGVLTRLTFTPII